MAHTATFTVEGRGRFPLDMLRYDCCFPMDPTSVANLETPGRYNLVRKVTLTRTCENRFWTPTVGRWESFGWNVVEEDFS